MLRSVVIIIAVFLLTALMPPAVSHGGEVLNSDGISVWADQLSHEMESNTFRANGNVMVFWNGVILVADTVTIAQKDRVALAEGHVRMVKGGDVLYCDLMTVNLDDETGEIINGNLFSRKSNFRIHGDRIRKVGDDQYRMEHGTFTVCDGDNPSWKFAADKLDVTLDGFAVSRNTLFYLKDIPLLYTPFMLFPVKTERQSGFLFPHLGNSTKKGFNIVIPFYWAISPSQEATFEFDAQSKRGIGLSAEYSYLRPKESAGLAQGYYIYDFNRNKGRGNLLVQQQEWLSPSLALKSDLNLVTDRDFFRDFAESSGEYNRQILDSSISISKNWQDISLAGETRYVQDLDAPSNRNTQQKLPSLGFSAIRRRLSGLPLYLGLDSSFVNFYRDDGIRGQRMDIRPFAALYLPFSRGLVLSAWGGYRERLYNAYSGDQGNGAFGFGLADAGGKLSASLERSYETNRGRLETLRHVMVPEISFGFVEQKDQGYLPFFDFNDRVLGNSTVTWSLSNYLSGKFRGEDGSAEYRDLLFLRLSQGYQISGAARDPVTGSPRDLLTLVDEGERLTDVRLEASFTPLKGLSLFTDSRYNTNNPRFSTIMAGFDMEDGNGNNAGLAYRFSRGEVEYMDGKLGLALVKPFVFKYNGRYSFDRDGFLETYYSLEYRHQCWSLELVYRDRPVNGDTAFIINFVLSGVGPLGRYKAF